MVEDEPLFEEDDNQLNSSSSDEDEVESNEDVETEEINEDLINEIFDQISEDINIMRGFCLTSYKALDSVVDFYEQRIQDLENENESFKQELIKNYRGVSDDKNAK